MEKRIMSKIIKILTIFILGLGMSISSYVYAQFENGALMVNITNYDDIRFPIKLDLEYKCTTLNSYNSSPKHYIVITAAKEERLRIEQINYETVNNEAIYNFQKVSLSPEQYPYIGSNLTTSVYEEDQFIYFDRQLDCHSLGGNRSRCYSSNGNECSLTVYHNQSIPLSFKQKQENEK